MLITGFAALMLAATAGPPGRGADCVAMLIPMAWHDGPAARRDARPRAVRADQGSRTRARCYRFAAR